MRKPVLVVTGTVLVLAGFAMLALPGPGLVVIAIGLAMFASAGVMWAARVLVRARQQLPDPDAEPGESTMVDTALDRLDEQMDDLEAVQEVHEEDRRRRERRYREQLVTTDDHHVDGHDAVDHVQARRLADSPRDPMEPR